MRILVIGSGAREHAIVKSLKREGGHTLYASPGNAGIAEDAEIVQLDVQNGREITRFAQEQDIALVIVGPEAPLIAGAVNDPRERGIAVFGPSRDAAQLEGSKTFAKEIMCEAGVPTGGAVRASSIQEVIEAMGEFGAPYVIKADGLAAGKGVLVTEDSQEAQAHAMHWLERGAVLVEEFLEGREVSLFFISDGDDLISLSPAQDYKRLQDADVGPNTGGMGAYSPVPWIAEAFGSEAEFIAQVKAQVAQPVINVMNERGTPFVGLLYCGLIVNGTTIKVIEFNARFGDPETQVILPRLKTPLSELLFAAATGTLGTKPPAEFSDSSAVTVVLASGGYPTENSEPVPLGGLENLQGVDVIHAATMKQDGALYSAGGRVLNIVATADSLEAAREVIYSQIDKVGFPGVQYRSDIAELS